MKTSCVVTSLVVIFFLLGCDVLTQMAEESEDLGPPETPDNLRCIEESTEQVRLAWDPPTATVDSFEVERSVGDNLDFVQLDVVSGSTRTYTDSSVSPGSVYYYRIRSVTGRNVSDFCTEIEVLTPLEAQLETFDWFQDGSYENVGELGDAYVGYGFSDQPYDVEVRIIDSSGTEHEWQLFERDSDGYVEILLPLDHLKDGQNSIDGRYVHAVTGDSGASGAVSLWRGYYGYGSDPHQTRVSIPRVTVDGGGSADDTLFILDFHDPETAPYVPIDSIGIIPATNGSLVVETTDYNDLLQMTFYSGSGEHEFARLFMDDLRDYEWEFDIRTGTDGSLTGHLLKDTGGTHPEPIQPEDNAGVIILCRNNDGTGIEADIFVAPPIPISGDDSRYNHDTGEFTFWSLAGEQSYELVAVWDFDGHITHHDVWVDSSGVTEFEHDVVFDLLAPVVLAEHNWYVVDYFGWITDDLDHELVEIWVDREQIASILNDPAHELHDRVHAVVATSTLPGLLSNDTIFRDLTDFGFSAADYQPYWIKPNTIDMPMMPIISKHPIVMYYNRNLVDVGMVPTTVPALLELADEPLPSGATAWLAYPQDLPYWFVPWLHYFGGAVSDQYGNPTLDTPEVEETLTFLSSEQLNALLPEETDDGYLNRDEAIESFHSGSVPFLIDEAHRWFDHYDELGTSLGIAPLPEDVQTYIMTSGVFIVDRDDPDGESAIAASLMNSFTETAIEEAYAELIDSGVSTEACFPALLAAQDLPGVTEPYAVIPGLLENTTPGPYFDYPIWWAIEDFLWQVISGDMTPREGAEAMQAAAR